MKKNQKIKMMTDILNDKFSDVSCVDFSPVDNKDYYQIHVNLTYPDGERAATYKQREFIRRLSHVLVTKGTRIKELTLDAANAIIASAILCQKSQTNFYLLLRDKPEEEEPQEEVTYDKEDREWMERLIGLRS